MNHKPAVLLLSVVLALVGYSFASPKYDGVLRKGSDGRMEAYMIPPFESNHASQCLELPSGETLIAWFSGTAEGQSDVAIVLARMPPGGAQFSSAAVVSQRDGYSNQNPVLFYDAKNASLFLFHSQQKANAGESDAHVWMLAAHDGVGKTWAGPYDIFSKPGSFTKNRLIESLTGEWLLPMYYADGSSSQQYSHIKTSTTYGAGNWGNLDFTGTDYLVQPSVVRPVPGEPSLTAFFRDRRAQHIYWSKSTDDGQSWSAAEKTVLPNNNAGIQATVLDNGHLAMVYNPQTSGRCPLAIAISEDGGATWPHMRHLELEGTDPSKSCSGEFSYPTLYQGTDGNIHVSYTYLRETIKYVVVSEEWVVAGDAP